MDESGGGYCPRCGKAVKEGASFCTGCGEPLGTQGGPPGAQSGGAAGETGGGAEQVTGGAAAPVPPPGPQASPPGEPPYPAPGIPSYGGEMPPAALPRKSRLPLVLGILGGILVLGGVAVLVLWLTLWRGGAGGTGDPIALAEKFISAMEKGDADAYLDCFDPESLSMEDNPFIDAMGMDMKKLVEMTFSMSEISFKGVQLEKKSERGDRAEVVTTAGTLTLSVMGFEEEYDLAEEPLRFKMVKKSGRWYLTEDPMPGSVGPEMDLEDLEDMDFEDLDLEELEEFLPEDLDLEELENMSPDELLEFLEELERLMEDLPSE